MRHDPKKIAAGHEAYRAKIEAATASIDAEIAVLQKRKSDAVHAIYSSHKTFTDGLIYSATARCKCGAGLYYDEGKSGINGEWTCSVCVLAERAGASMEGWDKNAHQSFPFREWEIKSEDQPSANGATTRPDPAVTP